MDLEIRDQRPSYVTFHKVPVEDRAETINRGIYTTRDVDFAYITPQGTKDQIERPVADWLANIEQQAKQGRIPEAWVRDYRGAYEAWRKGQEVPIIGTPIKAWPLLSPAQQQNVISANILTVEDLAAANEEALGRIGMGALDFKKRAATWIKAVTEPGKLAQANTALQANVKNLELQVAAQAKQIQELRGLIKTEVSV